MSEKIEFEMANADDPEGIIVATQKSLIRTMRKTIADIRADGHVKQPGLTWDQIDYFLAGFAEKKPKIFTQEAPF